jgi:maltooligosyltrehalose trehalohydrolase
MLFMGEEWGATTPWRFFTDHQEPDLARAVSEGRRREFATHGWATKDVPDPQDPETCRRSVLDWTEPSRPEHRELLDWYRELIALRRSCPELTDARLTEVDVEHDESWIVVYRGSVRVAANLGGDPVRLPDGELLLASTTGVRPGGELPGESLAILRMR